MKDELEFQSPFGMAGQIFNRLVLTNYLQQLLAKRNQLIKEFAESDQWKSILGDSR